MELLLQWELAWIDANSHLYDGEWHIRAVKENIRKKYIIAELQKTIKEQEELILNLMY